MAQHGVMGGMLAAAVLGWGMLALNAGPVRAQAPDAAPVPPAVTTQPAAPDAATAPASDPAPPARVAATFGPWSAECADTGQCRVETRAIDGAERLVITRFAGLEGYAVGFETPERLNDVDRPVSIRVDGRQIVTVDKPRGYNAFEAAERFFLIDPKRASTVLAALLKSRNARIEYLDIGGRPFDADFVTDQLALALDHVEAKAGFKPKQRVAVALPKSLEVAPPVDKAARLASAGLPLRLLQRHALTSDCEDPMSPSLAQVKPVIGALSATAMLYAIPCLRGQFQISYRLYVVESGEIGGMTPAYFAAYDPRFGWRGTDLLANVSYDPDNRRLSALWKASGPGDCGWSGVWRWQDYAFAMETVRAQVACDGSRPDPATWPAVFGP